MTNQSIYPILYIESKHSIFALVGKANKHTHMGIGEFSREQKEKRKKTLNTTIILNVCTFLFIIVKLWGDSEFRAALFGLFPLIFVPCLFV